MKAVTAAILLLATGCAAQGNLKGSQPASLNKNMQLEVFRTVLQGWLDENERANSVYVAKSTYVVPETELLEFTACANNGAARSVTSAPEPVAEIIGSISSPRLHFINRRFWLTPDPNRISKTIEEGRPAGILSLSSVAFDANKSVAVLHLSFTCGSLCGGGKTLVLDKTPSGWVQRPTTCDAWIS